MWHTGSRAQAQQLCTGLAAPWHVGSSWTRDRTHVPCTSRRTLNLCTTREVPNQIFYRAKMQIFIQVDKVTDPQAQNTLKKCNSTMIMHLSVRKLTFTIPELGQSLCQTILMLKIKVLMFEAYPSSSGGSLGQRYQFKWVLLCSSREFL